MKIDLNYQFDGDCPDDRYRLKRLISADSTYHALWEISQNIFRPARKHGYSDQRLAKFNDKDGELSSEVYKIIRVLEDMFYEELEKAGIDLSDYM